MRPQATTSAVTAELVGVSSLLTYDIWKIYVRPKVSSWVFHVRRSHYNTNTRDRPTVPLIAGVLQRAAPDQSAGRHILGRSGSCLCLHCDCCRVQFQVMLCTHTKLSMLLSFWLLR